MKKKHIILILFYFLVYLNIDSQNLYLDIKGENLLETKKIDSLGYDKIHKNFNSINKTIEGLQQTLYKEGYIEANVKNIKRINDSSYKTNIALKTQYKTILIKYDAQSLPKSLLKTIATKVTDSLFSVKVKSLENKLKYLNNKLSEEGLPFSKLKLTNITPIANQQLIANLTVIDVDKKRNIDKILVNGYKKFPKSYLKQYLKIRKGQVFNLNSINKKTERLKVLKFANQIKPAEILFSKDSTTLYLYIKKKQTNTFDGFLGFGTNDTTNRLEFDGFLNLGLVNNLNYGETLRLLYKSDEGDQKTFEASLSLPYLFKTPIGLDLELNIFRRDTSFSTTRQSVKINYQINTKQKVLIGINNTKSSNLLTTNINTQINDFNTSFYALAYSYIKQTPNDLLFPVNTSLFVETNFGNRSSENQKEQQSLLRANLFKIINFNARNSIYIRVDGAQLNSNTFFENELQRFGGINSIRGFEENSLLASQYGLINSEYRYKLSNSIYVHTIIDAAYLDNKISSISEKLFGYGFGLGLLTKSGLLKLNYANGKSENQKFKLSNSKVHISLKATF